MDPVHVGACSFYEITAALLHYKRISDMSGKEIAPPPSEEFDAEYAAALEKLKTMPGVKVH